MRGRQYMPVVDLRLLRSLHIVRHPQSHEYHMTLKLERRKGKERLFILRKLGEYTMRIGEHMAQSSKLGRELMIYAIKVKKISVLCTENFLAASQPLWPCAPPLLQSWIRP